MYDIEENNNADLVEMFISQPEVSEELRNEQYITADYMLAQSFQETCTMYSLKAIFDEIFPINSITNTQEYRDQSWKNIEQWGISRDISRTKIDSFVEKIPKSIRLGLHRYARNSPRNLHSPHLYGH